MFFTHFLPFFFTTLTQVTPTLWNNGVTPVRPWRSVKRYAAEIAALSLCMIQDQPPPPMNPCPCPPLCHSCTRCNDPPMQLPPVFFWEFVVGMETLVALSSVWLPPKILREVQFPFLGPASGIGPSMPWPPACSLSLSLSISWPSLLLFQVPKLECGAVGRA